MKIIAVGDVHGNYEKLVSLVERTKRARLVFLGDLVDRGKNNVETIELFMKLVKKKRAEMVLGNHDIKLARTFQSVVSGKYGIPDISSTETRNTFEEFMFKDRFGLLSDFVEYLKTVPAWKAYGRHLLVHGACNPEFFLMKSKTVSDFGGVFNKFVNKYDPEIRGGFRMSIYGETDGFLPNGYPNRIYDWLDRLPPNTKVVFGHDGGKFGGKIIEMKGKYGAEAVCIDTLCYETDNPLGTYEFDYGKKDFLIRPDMYENEKENLMYSYDRHLVIMVGPSGAGKSTLAKNYEKQNYSVISTDAIREELTGDFRNQEKNDEVFRVFSDRILKNIHVKRRNVVTDSMSLRVCDRLRILASGGGCVHVTYHVVNRSMEEKKKTAEWRAEVKGLLEKTEAAFQREIRKILDGDGYAHVTKLSLSPEYIKENEHLFPELDYEVHP